MRDQSCSNCNHNFWPLIIEKTWAKIAGNYGNLDNYESNQKAMSGMLGVPVFNYEIYDLNTSPYDLLNNAMQNKFVAVVINWFSYNSCGFEYMGSFSVLSTFNLKFKNGTLV
jgi:hypothetical protein